MGVADIFGKTFQILRKNPRIVVPYLLFTFLVGGVVLYTVFSGLGNLYGSGIFGLRGIAHANLSAGLPAVIQFFTGLLTVMVLLGVFSLIVTPFLLGTYINIADQGYGKGIVAFNKAFKVARDNYSRLLGIELLLAVIWIIVLVVLAAIFASPIIFFGANLASGIWLVIGMGVGIAVSVLLGILFYEAYTVAVLENRDVADAIRRSISIGKMNLARIFTIFLITAAILIVYITIITILQVLLETGLAGFGSLFVGATIAQVVNYMLSSGLAVWMALIPVGFYKEYVRSAERKIAKGKAH